MPLVSDGFITLPSRRHHRRRPDNRLMALRDVIVLRHRAPQFPHLQAFSFGEHIDEKFTACERGGRGSAFVPSRRGTASVVVGLATSTTAPHCVSLTCRVRHANQLRRHY